MQQSGLSAYADASERPAAEARAVAGNSSNGGEVVDLDERRFPPTEGTIDLGITQVNYTVEQGSEGERPIMHVFGRDSAGEAHHVRVFDFRPYFYAPTPTLTDEDLSDSRITDSEAGYESIRGEKLTKIFGQTPRDVGNMRDRFDHYEADILFPNRFLIDKGINSGIRVPDRRAEDGALKVHHEEVEAVEAEADLRVHNFDIEVDDRSGFPEEGEEPIVCLTSHDSRRGEYIGWLGLAPDGNGYSPEDLPEYAPITDNTTIEIRAFESEEAMLDAYLTYIEKTDPDVMTGWNCLPENSEILMANGRTKEIQHIETGDEVVGSADQESTVATVTNKWKSEKRIYEYELADGTSLRSSGDHRIMVGDDETVDWKHGREIELGDYVLKPRRLSVAETRVPTLSELVPAENQRFVDKTTVAQFKKELPYGAVSELATAFDLAKETLYHPETDTWTPKRCEQAAAEYDAIVPDGGRVYRRTGVDLDRELTEEELYLAGLVLTDGSMSRTDGIRFYNTRKELHDEFPGDGVLQPDGKGCYKQNVLDYASMYAFNGLGIPFGDKNAVQADLSAVYEMPENFIARFLAGVIDGDGNVNSSVSISAANSTIGEWFVKLFKRLGIYSERRGRTIRVPDAARDIQRLKDCILPHMNHSEKVAAIHALDGGKSGRSESIPYALFEPSVGSDAKRIGNDKHRRGIDLKRHETDSDEWEEYVFVEVKDIEITGTETTYDIETTTHNFIAEGCLVHNCDDFDAPYLIDRLDRLDPSTEFDLSIERLSRVNEVWRSDWQGPNIKGRVVFDLLYAYKRIVVTELDSYRLDAVAETELGVGKERYAGDIGDLWEQDPERLLEYNVRDVELCVEINRQQGIIPFWDEVRTFVGCKLEDAPTPGDTVDMYVLHKVHGDFALPSKGRVESEEYEGGAVFDPITGVKENVTVLDLKSLYPMCMVTINASPETKADESYDGETYRAPNGMAFKREPDGIIREMVDELLTERDRKKARRAEHAPGSYEHEIYDRQQGAVKVIMNSLYGVTGWDRFRLYDKDVAGAVTATGREVIEFTEQAANEIGYQVTYGDTDSVMLELGGDVLKSDAIEQSFEIEEHINASYDAFAREELGAEEHRFEIEFEKLYRRFFQAGRKKRYAGHIIWKEGKDVDDIDITGFEYKRSDIAPITKEVQRDVIEMIVHGEDLENVKSYVHEVITDFQKGELDLDRVAIPGGIGKRLDAYDTDTARIRGAKYANLLLGTNFNRGSKPKRLYLKKVHPTFFRRMETEEGFDPQRDRLYGAFKRNSDVICFEYPDQIPEEFEVDWEKMLEKTLANPISPVLTALDISWDEVKSGQQQTGLGSFM